MINKFIKKMKISLNAISIFSIIIVISIFAFKENFAKAADGASDDIRMHIKANDICINGYKWIIFTDKGIVIAVEQAWERIDTINGNIGVPIKCK